MARWKSVPGYGSIYEVSDRGSIRNAKTGRVRKAYPNKTGHLVVRLYKNENGKGHLVHRLVLLAFTGPSPEGKDYGLHRNGDPTDNRLSNLYWGTLRDNNLDAVRHGTHPSARKSECLRGHEFSGHNLVVRRSGKRACRACDAARVAVNRGSTESMQTYADRIYQSYQ